MAASALLTVDDFRVVYKAVRDARTKWRAIGIEFGFTPSDLDDIEDRCGRKGNDCCLQAVLEKWLKKRSLRPTWKSLVTVLGEDTVGEEGIAVDIEEKYVKSTETADQLVDEESEGIRQRKRSPPSPTEEEGQREPLAKHLKRQQTAANQDPRDPMKEFADYLKDLYENSPIAPRCKEDPIPPEFVNLAIIKKDRVTRAEADAFTKATLRGGIDEIAHKKEPVHLEDIFKPDNARAKMKCVLVEGAPGVGKSMLAWELCRKWDSTEVMKKFLAVVLLRLRDKQVQEAKDIGDLFCYPDDPDLQKTIVERVRSSRGEGILLVLDGFDEFPNHLRKDSLVAKLIQSQCLSRATVLVTSRPSARADLECLCPKPDKDIEVLGFTSKQIYQYATSKFGSDTSLLADFDKYILTNPAIKSMTYIPVNTAIVVEIYGENRAEGGVIPRTMTQLYTELTLTRLRRYLSDNGQTRESLPRTLEDLPQTLLDQLVSLGKLAFIATLKQEVIFDTLDGCNPLGLMTETQQLYIGERGPVSYNFFHLILQEFLSALFLSRLPAGKQKVALEKSGERMFSHMDVVWIFLAGLTGFQDIGWHVLRSRLTKSEGGVVVTPFVVQCLYEAQERVNCESVLGPSVSLKYFSSSSVLDWFSVGYLVTVGTCSWKLELSRVEELEMLLCGLRTKEKVRGSIETLIIFFCPNPDKEIVGHLEKMPCKVLQQITTLEVAFCGMNCTEFDQLADIVHSLKHLSIGGNPVRNGGLVKLLQKLAATDHLHTLNIVDIQVGHDDILALSQLIRPVGSLRELVVGHNNNSKSSECVELMMKTVLSPSSLKKLRTYYIDWTPTSFALLEENSNLTQLTLADCTIGSEAMAASAKVIKNNTTLTKLYIGDVMQSIFFNSALVFIQAEEQDQLESAFLTLSDSLKSNNKLTHLDLGFCKYQTSPCLGREAVLALVHALQCNQSLESLQLSEYFLEHCDIDELVEMDSRVIV